MEIAYTLVGADGQQYGPHPFESIQAWIAEGRIMKETQMLRSDDNIWRTAGDFGELQWPQSAASARPPALPVAEPAAAAPARTEAAISPALLAKVKSGAGWFYWVAGLSLVNTISALTGSDWRFIIGTGLTEIFNEVGKHVGSGGKMVVLALDAVFLGTLIVLGVFAGKRHLWAFVLGMLIYAGDALIYVLAQEWFGVAFHAFVVYCMFIGFQAAREITAAQRDG